MVDNTNNLHGVAPDKGTLRGPIVATNINTTYLMTHNASWPTSYHANASHVTSRVPGVLEDRQSGGYWMETITHGQMPLQPGPYAFFRNVKDFGANGDGSTDDTAAINAAVSAGNRCGLECGSTTLAGAS
jgi:Pectate lyase superfamily protein